MKIVKKIFVFIIGVFICFVFLYGIIEESKYIYECSDVQGNKVYCTFVTNTKGGMFGHLEDNTKIQITSYKRIEKEE